jgi:hypothetical protein
MSSLRPEITSHASGDGLEPLAVSPRQACRLLNVGITYLYGLINNNELESYLEGHARKITMKSIHARQERLLAAARGAVITTETAQPRRRGRPRKTVENEVRA